MALHLFNTLAGKVEEFAPLEGGTVRMYTCGPTVYDYAHIGNYRTFVFQDVLRRYLEYVGWQVNQVVNLTDVDDKTIRNSQAAGVPLRTYTDKFIEAFKADRDLLNLEEPRVFARATDHIEDMVKLIQVLKEKGFAYENEGSVYFRVDQFADYGKLSKLDLSAIRDGARVDSDEYDKANVRDFVLWKAAKAGEPFWDTPLGKGRPGWHIECSVMAMKYLGPSFDIHSGGSDLIFPHHENEIAQSEAATGRPFARFWLHAEHLVVKGEKMSKSLGNYYTLRDLVGKGFKPLAIRYLLCSVPHRKPLNFTFDGIHQAQQSIDRLRNFKYRLTQEKFAAGENPAMAERAQRARQEYERGLDDNLNTAEALAAVFELVRDGNTAMDSGEFHTGDCAPFLDVLARFDRVFAVMEDSDHEKLRKHGLIAASGAEGAEAAAMTEAWSDAQIEARIAERVAARKHGNFKLADEIRQSLLAAGVILEDTKAGTRWKRK
jgi:cysteinyl-tRNA synthetase